MVPILSLWIALDPNPSDDAISLREETALLQMQYKCPQVISSTSMGISDEDMDTLQYFLLNPVGARWFAHGRGLSLNTMPLAPSESSVD